MALPLARLFAGLSGLLLAGCCVAPPLTQDWMKVGFRAPEQTVGTFQTAVRADSPDLEYRCFSTGFRSRNGISKLTWREAREELRRKNPWLRKGLADAKIDGMIRVLGDAASMDLVTHGHRIHVGLVREDFAELWMGDKLVSDEPDIHFTHATALQKAADGQQWFSGWAVLPEGQGSAADVTDVHVGREWKIDSFESVEPPRESNAAREEAAPRQEPD